MSRLENYGDGIIFEAQSNIYKTEPQGAVKDQPWFANAVVRLKVESDIWAPAGLLSTLQAIEGQMGRVRHGEQGGPRVIDLDLLLFGDVVMESEYLTLPHPRMFDRAFVLVPLREVLLQGTVFPDGRDIHQALAEIAYTLDGYTISQK